MAMTLESLRQSGTFRTLAADQQVLMAQNLWQTQLAKDPRFAMLDDEHKRRIIQDLALQSVTFEDEQLGQWARKAGVDYANGSRGALVDKAGYEALNQAIKTSGVASLVEGALGGPGVAVRRSDRARALAYFKTVEAITGRSDAFGEVGAILGFVGDVAAVNTVMAPAVGAATRGIQMASRGVKATSLSLEAIKRMPVLNAKLAFYGPIAAESAIEALPYYFVEEARRRGAGEPTVLSGGVSEVAKTLGINAAADFVVGTAITSLLHYGGKTIGQIFKPSGAAKAAYADEAQFQEVLQRLAAGDLDPRTIEGLHPITQDRVYQAGRIKDFLVRGAANQDIDIHGRAALLANDLGEIWGRTGSEYRMWKWAGSRPYEVRYKAFNDLEDDLSHDFFKRYQMLSDAEKATRLRPENAWAFNRGKLLAEETSILEPSGWEVLDPELAARWDKKARSPKTRNIITKAEADALSTMGGSGVHVVQTEIQLGADVRENALLHNFDLLKGQPSITVKPSANPNALFIGLAEAPVELYEKAVARAADIVEANGLSSIDEAVSSAMMNSGFDHVKLPDGTTKFFTTRTTRLIGSAEDALQSVRKPVMGGDAATRVSVSTVAGRYIDPANFGANSSLVSHAAVATIRSGDLESYQNFIKLYLGVPDITPYATVAKTTGDKLVAEVASNGHLNILVPTRITSYTDTIDGIKKFFAGLDAVSEKFKTRAKFLRSGEYLADLINRKPNKFMFPSDIDSEPWSSAIIERKGGILSKKNGEFDVLDADGKRHRFASTADLQAYAVRLTLDEDFVRHDLSLQGARLVRPSRDVYQIRAHDTGKLLAEGPTLSAALDSMGYAPKKLPNAYGPTNVRVTSSGLEFDVGKTRMARSQSSAQKYIASFQDNTAMLKNKRIKTKKQGYIVETPPRQYEVYLEKYDVTERFDNPGDATKFLTSEAKSYDELSKIAAKKGLDFTVDNGFYVLRATDKTMRAANLDELGSYMREYPDISQSVRSILDAIDPSIESSQSIADIVAQYRDSRPMAGMNPFGLPPEFEFPERKPMSAFMSILKSTEQTTAWVEWVSKQINDPQLLKFYRNVERGARAADADNHSAMKILDAMFRDENNKLIPKQSRQRIFYTIGANTPDEVEKLAQMYGKATGEALPPLTPLEERIAGQVREYLDSLSRKFGISFEKLIGKYMPRLRDLRNSANNALLNEMVSADELVGKMHFDQKEIKFWAEFERTDDFLSYALKDDALEVLMMYTTQGHKKFYMNDSWSELNRYMTASNLENPIVERMQHYREALMGATRTPGEKAVEDFGARFMVALKRNPVLGKLIKASDVEMADKGRELFRTILGFNYFVSMGWKPFLAIRNSLQTWSTAAPRLGISWVWDAMKKVLGNPEEYYKRALARGVITDKPPIVNQGFDPLSPLGKVAENSMKWFKNADDYTRVWVYEAASDKFQNAIDAYARGMIKSQGAFADLSGMDVLDAESQKELWAILAKSNFSDATGMAQAKHVFANKMSEETMFPYRASESPPMYQGVVGKLFGQFGTYSVAYRANLARMFTQAPLAKRAEVVASYLAINGAIWGTFAALGIKTNDFIPFAPAIFNGGPLYDTAVTAIAATGSGYDADQARAKLENQLKSGPAQVRYVKKYLEYQSQGDPYRAWLSLTGVPMIPE